MKKKNYGLLPQEEMWGRWIGGEKVKEEKGRTSVEALSLLSSYWTCFPSMVVFMEVAVVVVMVEEWALWLFAKSKLPPKGKKNKLTEMIDRFSEVRKGG